MNTVILQVKSSEATFARSPQIVGPSESVTSSCTPSFGLHTEQGQQHPHHIAVGTSPEATSPESVKGSPMALRSSHDRDLHLGSKAAAWKEVMWNSPRTHSHLFKLSSPRFFLCPGTGVGDWSCPVSHLSRCLILILLVGLKKKIN